MFEKMELLWVFQVYDVDGVVVVVDGGVEMYLLELLLVLSIEVMFVGKLSFFDFQNVVFLLCELMLVSMLLDDIVQLELFLIFILVFVKLKFW